MHNFGYFEPLYKIIFFHNLDFYYVDVIDSKSDFKDETRPESSVNIN